MATPPAASSSPHLLSLSQGREGNGRDPAARGGSAQIRSRTGGPPSLEIVQGGLTRLQPCTETPETLATRGGPTPQPPRKGRAPAAGHLRRPPTMVARIWTSCCSYCFRWTRTSPPSWLLRLPTPSSYPLSWSPDPSPLSGSGSTSRARRRISMRITMLLPKEGYPLFNAFEIPIIIPCL
nr:uncharacterized protein LOC120963888 [Aegilops tauschii subsp. strangulata]